MIQRTKNFVFTTFQITLSVILASIGLKAFLLPNDFLDGGVTGIAILIHTLFGWNTSLVLILASIPFLIIGYFTVSRKILVKSIISIVALALFIQLESFTVFTSDKLLIAFFGGGFLGAGIGLAIRNGTVLDGSELLGVFVNKRFGLSIGQIILVFNVILFGIALLMLPTENVLYSVLTYFVTARVIDMMVAGFEDFIGVMIISKLSTKIEERINKELGVGMTVFKGERGYGKNGKTTDYFIIQTIVNRIDIRKIEQIVDEVDAGAFVVEYDVNTIKGGILRRYLKLNKKEKSNPILISS